MFYQFIWLNKYQLWYPGRKLFINFKDFRKKFVSFLMISQKNDRQFSQDFNEPKNTINLCLYVVSLAFIGFLKKIYLGFLHFLEWQHLL